MAAINRFNPSALDDEFEPVPPDSPFSYQNVFGKTQATPTGSRIADTGIDIARGAVSLGEAAVGVGNLATAGRLQRAIKDVYRPEETHQILSGYYSPQRQQEEADIAASEGFTGRLGALARRPGALAGRVVQSVPSMLPAVGAARFLALRGAAPGAVGTAAAIGEGATTAAQQGQQVIGEDPNNVSGMYTQVPAGILTGAISKVAGRFGGDIEAALAGRGLGVTGSAPVRAVKGAVGEGLVEEFPQSMQEQMHYNLATGRPWNEGLLEAGAEGALVGGLVGGGVGAFTGGRGPVQTDDGSWVLPPPPPYVPRTLGPEGMARDLFTGEMTPVPVTPPPASPEFELGGPPVDYSIQQGELDFTAPELGANAPIQGTLPVTRDLLPPPRPEALVVSPEGFVGDPRTIQNARLNARLEQEQLSRELGSVDRGTQQAIARREADNASRENVVNQVTSALREAFVETRGRDIAKGVETVEKARFLKGATSLDEVVTKLDAAIAKTRDQSRKETLTVWRDKLQPYPKETQDAIEEIPQQAGVPAEPQGGAEVGQAAETGGRDRVLGPAQGQEVQPQQVTESPEQTWEEGYRVSEDEPAFADLGPELRSEWEVAVENNAATTKVFDNIVKRHKRNQRVARMNEKAKALRGDLGDDVEAKQIKITEASTPQEIRTAQASNAFDFTTAIEEFRNSKLFYKPLYDMFKATNEGRTLDLMKLIVKHGDKAESTMAAALIKLRVLPSISFGDRGQTTLGTYDAFADSIIIDAGQFLERGGVKGLILFRSTVLHEVVHAATMRNMVRYWKISRLQEATLTADDEKFIRSEQYDASQKIFSMYEQLQQNQPDLVNEYGMTNPFEFIAEALSNPRFQEKLDAIPMTEFTELAGGRKSLWQWLVDAIRSVLDIPVTAGSALSQVLKNGATIIEDRVDSIVKSEWYQTLSDEDKVAIHRIMLNEQVNQMGLESIGEEASRAYRDIKRTGTTTEAKMVDAIGDIVNRVKYDTPAADVIGAVKKFGTKLLGIHQIDELYGKEISMKDPATGKMVYPIRGFIDNMLRMGRDRDDMLRIADSVKQKMTALPKQSRDRLGVVLTGMSELNAKTEVTVRNGKVSAVRVTDWGDQPAEAQKLWSGLSQQEQNVYGSVVNEIDRMRRELLAATKNNMEAYGEKGVGLLNEVLSAYTKVKGDYFPFMRFGDHVVVWKSEALQAAEAAEDTKLADELKANRTTPHYIVQRFESKGEANRMMDELRAKGELRGDDGKLVKGGVEYHKQQEYIAGLDRVPPTFINKLNEVFDVDTDKVKSALEAAKVAGDSKKVVQLQQDLDRATYGKEMKSLVASLYVQALPEFSVAKRHLRRAGIKGFSTDAVRVYSNYADRIASATSKAKYMRPVLEALSQAERAAQIKEVAGDQTFKDVVDVLRRHYDAIINPKFQSGEWQSVMTNAAYIWYLGMTPSFAVTNLAQGPLISAPVIAARLGTSLLKTQGAIARAMKDSFGVQQSWLAEAEGNLFRRMYSSGPGYIVQDVLDENGKPTGETILELDLSKSGLAKDEQDLIKKLYKSSLVDLNQTHDITSSAEGISVKQREAMKVVTMFSHHSEVLNRLSTGLAAFRLAKGVAKAKGTAMDPADFAEKIIRDTHFDYSNVAAPLYFKPGYNPVARIMFQFRKYQAAMLFLLGRNLSQAFGTGEEAKVARKTLVGLMMTHGAVAGTLGMPLVGTLAAMAAAALDSDDDPWDRARVEAEYRNWLADTLGVEAGEVVAAGVFRAPGVRDVLPATIGEKVGQQDIASPLRNMRASNREAARDTLLRAVGTMISGPSGGLTGDLLTAWEMFGKGDMQRGYEYASPKFIRDVFKAYRFADEGLVNTRGETRVGKDKLSAIDEFWQAMGYTPADVSESYKASGAVRTYSEALQERRNAIITRFANAQARGDIDEAVRIRDELVQRFNQANPSQRINPRDMLNAVRSRGRAELRTNEQGVVVNPRQRELAELGRFANVE